MTDSPRADSDRDHRPPRRFAPWRWLLRPAPGMSKENVSPVRRWAGLAVMIALFVLLIAFAAGRIRTFQVTSESMEPTIRKGDYVLVRACESGSPRRGDVVALDDPEAPGQWLCKRVVAVPGDTVAYRDGLLYVDGERPREPFVEEPVDPDTRDFGPVRMGAEEYFVQGDNRPISYDSVEFGPVERSEIHGRVTRIYWPKPRMRRIENPYEARR